MAFDLECQWQQGDRRFFAYTRTLTVEEASTSQNRMAAGFKVKDGESESPLFEVVGYGFMSKQDAVMKVREILVAHFGLSAAA